MTFSELNLNSPLLNALDDLGFTKPTTIQHKAFSVIMSGKDVCGIAQTGTGKTFAFLLPCLRMWQFNKDRCPQILIIVPTRELVVQIVEEAKKLTVYMPNFVSVGVYGGVNMKPQAAEVAEGADLIVGTPGRLYDLILNRFIKLKAIKHLIIDEVDEMLNLGFRTQLINIIDLLPPKRQNLLFSATLIPEVETIMETFFNMPMVIEAAPTGTPLENIDQQVYYVPNFNTKVNLLKLLLTHNKDMIKVLVFVATKKQADQIFALLEPDFSGEMGVIHSNKAQNHRFNTVNLFQDGVYKYIIATDLVARGIDISDVSHVINFDVPDPPPEYIHRIGRTGRAEKNGNAIILVADRERTTFEAIETFMNYKVPEKPLPVILEVSTELIDDEKPAGRLKEIVIKQPKQEERGAAFHEKLAKNKKVNNKVSHQDKMKAKYGKPKKRKPKE